MDISSISSAVSPEVTLSYEGRIEQLRDQIVLLQSRLGKIDKDSGDDPKVKQQQIDQVILQIKQLLAQIHRMQERQALNEQLHSGNGPSLTPKSEPIAENLAFGFDLLV